MSAYLDLIPSTSPSRRRSAYDDLLPGGTPAAPERPAEDARLAGDEAATALGAGVRDFITGEVMAEPEPSAPWGAVARSIIPAAGAQIRNAFANWRRMANESSIQSREAVLQPDAPRPDGTTLPGRVRRAVERQQALLDQERAARTGIVEDATAAHQDLADATPKDMTTVQKAVHSAGSSAPTTLAALAAGIVTRSPAVGMVIAGGGGSAVQAGSTYGEALEKGADHRQASLAASIDAAIEGLDALPVGVALKPGSAFAKRLAKTIGTEAATEGGQQLMQDFRAMAMEDPDKTLGEVWENFKVSVLAGGIGGTVYGAVGGAANAGRKEPAPMHSEAAPASDATLDEPAVVEPAQAAVEPAAKGPYSDLIPAGQDLDGRVEPVGTIEELISESEALSKRAKDIATNNIGVKSDEEVAQAIAETRRAEAAAKPPVEPWEEQAEEQPPASREVAAEDHEMLRDMAKQAVWFEQGGKAAGWTSQSNPLGATSQREMNEAGTGRTNWIGMPEWARGLDANREQITAAVEKAIEGKKLGAKQQRIVTAMLREIDELAAVKRETSAKEWEISSKDVEAEGLDPVDRNVVDSDLVAKAVAIDEAAVETAAMQHDNDDAAFMEAVRRIINAQKDQDSEAAGGRQANRGAPRVAQADGGFQLEQQTEAELAARERAGKEAAARKKAEEEAAERKRIADAQRGDFTLTGSDRVADVNPQQGGLKFHGMPAGTAVANAGTVPPASATSVGKDQARPDAIRAAMRKLFGAPLSEKGLSKKYLGIYKIKPQTIRLQNRNDLRTAAHEVGHHISNLNRPFRKIMRRHQAELVKIAPRPYIVQALQKHHSMAAALADGDTRRLLIEEGFAEFIAEYLTSPATIQARVPAFYADFDTWLKANPNYSKALQQVQDMVGAHQALPAADKILAKVGAFTPTLGERAAAVASKDTWDTFAQATLDKWHPLKAMVQDLMPGVPISKNPYAAARLLAGDAAIIEDWIADFTTPFDYAKRLDGKNYGKPLKKILEPILSEGSLNAGQREQEMNNFKAYLIARRANELMKVGKENLLTKEEIAEGLKLETIQPGRSRLFEVVAKDVYAYNDRLVEYAVEGGLLAPDVAAKFKQYANYIPFFREPDGDAKGDGRGNPFKKLTGGTANLRDPIANLIQNTANIIHATNRNAMVAKAVALAEKVPGGGRWIETVKVPQEAHAIATKRIIEQLEKEGVQVDLSMAQGMADIQTFFTPSGKGDDRTRTIVYKDGGQLKAAQINDPILWKAIGNIPPLEMGLIGKIIAFPAQTLRAGVVLDPTFMVRNFVRDTLSATVQSKGKFIPVASTAQGIKMMAQQKDAYRLWRAFGGAFSDQFREPEESAAIIQRMAKRGNFSPTSIVTPTRWLDALRRVGSFTESGSRIGEFAATYKPGDVDSALQAALNAREVSTDFGMKGGHEVIQVLTRITPFMNPAMQGLYKTARVLSGNDGKAAAAKAAILGVNMALVSIALALMNSDEDWYQRIEEWEKTTYWHFKVGDNVFRIPKPFEYGTLFASMPEAMALRAAGAEGGEDFKKRMLQALGQVFGFRVIPQAASLVAEPWANKSIFTGRQIVPDRQSHLEPGLQANPNTSKTAQAAGEAANVSPAVIDNMVRNMFGTIGVHVVTAADLVLEGTGAFPPGRERGWQTWPAVKAFVRDPDNANTKQQRDFYEALEKYRTAVASVKEMKNRGDDARAETYSIEKSDELDSAKSAEAAAKRLAKIRKAVRAIEWDRDMTPAEKREAINAHNEDAQEIAAEQTRLYQAAKKSYARPATNGGQ